MEILQAMGTGTPDELRGRLQRWLGSDQPISDQALAAIAASSWFASKLSNVRDHPQAVRHLLDNPPNAPLSALQYLRNPASPVTGDKQHGSLGQSVARWVLSGMSRVDEETRERRWQACLSCPHLRDAPGTTVHKLTAAVVSSRKVCGLCGCNVRAKGAVPTESCPDPHPDRPEVTRWAEPLEAKA